MATGAVTSNTTDEAEIRRLIEAREKAVRSRDAKGSMANIASDIVSFDVVNPLQRTGSDELRKRAEEGFASFQGPIGYETRDLEITAGDDVAFARGLSHVNGMRQDGGHLDMWWRTTLCFSKIDGKWMITHEHNSVPFDVESGKASLDLKPEDCSGWTFELFSTFHFIAGAGGCKAHRIDAFIEIQP
jgi:ketosteroid isomerase-like protein